MACRQVHPSETSTPQLESKISDPCHWQCQSTSKRHPSARHEVHVRACRTSQSSNSFAASRLSSTESEARASHCQLLPLTGPACAVPEFAAAASASASMRARNGFVDDRERLVPEDGSAHIPLSRAADMGIGIGDGVGISGGYDERGLGISGWMAVDKSSVRTRTRILEEGDRRCTLSRHDWAIHGWRW